MKIVWVADNTFGEMPTGGAEATNTYLIGNCPYSVDELTPSTLVSKKQLLNYDIAIFGNIKWFSDEQMDWILSHPVKMKYEHDYWNLVRPNQEAYKKPFWESCKVQIFHSPMHIEEYKKLYPDIDFPNVWLQPSAMDVDKMYAGEKKDISIYVGSLTPHKGIMDSIAWAEEHGETLFVWGVGECLASVMAHPNAVYCGTIHYEGLLRLYSQASKFVFLPNWVDPFARTTVEARLSGCELVVNDNVGAMSYRWWGKKDEEYRNILKDKRDSFWKVLDRL